MNAKQEKVLEFVQINNEKDLNEKENKRADLLNQIDRAAKRLLDMKFSVENGHGRIDENMVDNATSWLTIGIKEYNRMCDKAEAMEWIHWFNKAGEEN